MTILSIFDFFKDIFHHPMAMFKPEDIIKYGGMLLLFLCVYAQIGLFFCFFLPGDALLFTTGVFVATGNFDQPILSVCIVLVIAAFMGNLSAYIFGRKAGPLLFKRKDSIFFKHEHLITADQFFQKNGAIAVTGCFFLPIIRTFTPVIAGVVKYPFPRFVLCSLLGALLWINILVLAGYFLGDVPFVEKNLKYIILGMIIGLTLPVILKIVRSSRGIKTK
ncbi:MAG: VTT domain-containing protein [Chitinophagales bacterium]|nr:VTT domain-containing protein [Chitinophagales bacterium]